MCNKFMFDTNCFYNIKFKEKDLLNSDINQYFVTRVQYNELKNKPVTENFSEKYKQNLLSLLGQLDKDELLTESFILGHSSAGILGYSKLGTTENYAKFLEELNAIKFKLNNKEDSLIAEVAVVNNIILVTIDKILRNVINNYYPSMAISLEEFKNNYTWLKHNL